MVEFFDLQDHHHQQRLRRSNRFVRYVSMGNTNSIARFYRHYVDVTNDGVVLNLDLSLRNDLGPRADELGEIILTEDESHERHEWNRRKEQISQYYDTRKFPNVILQEDFLRLRVVAPCLHPDPVQVSARSPPSDFRTKNRHYPQSIAVWNSFRSSVEAFSVDGQRHVPSNSVRGVRGSLSDFLPRGTERVEEEFLLRTILQPLELAGLLGIVRLGSIGCQGEPDFFIKVPEQRNTDNIKIVGETKTTHNLALPMEAQRVVEQYNDAREAIDNMPEQGQHEQQQRPLGWSNVGHPVSQILGYMILNHCRYGALTSASRTYFVRIWRDTSGEERVLITDAWFVGQRDYLRAWAFLFASSQADNQPKLDQVALSEAWLQSTPEKVKKRPRTLETSTGTGPASRRQRTSTSRRSRGRSRHRANARTHATSVHTARLCDFKVGPAVGYGRRGTTFSATWKGEIVAVKLFDTHKNQGREAFEREIKAYEHLKAVWGRLVPAPKFTAEAFGVIFLGMQMAERPPQSARVEDWDDALFELEEKYGFRHLDVDGSGRGPGLHNRMILRDDTGRSQPILIDLEEYELVE